MDKENISYNLSLVDPQNIEIDTPEETKIDIYVDGLLLEENKLEKDVSSIFLKESKPADGGSLKDGLNLSDLGLIREFPLAPIDDEFKTHILKADGEEEGVFGGATGLIPELINASKNKKMKD